jgi:uncharacterized protein YbaR (Trm112 family)
MRRLILLIAAALLGVLAWLRLRRPAEPEFQPAATETSSPLGELGGEVDPELLAILACPLDKQPVSREGNYLVCSECGRRYPIRDGIPVMLVEEALLPERPPEQPAEAAPQAQVAVAEPAAAEPTAETPAAASGAGAADAETAQQGGAEAAEQAGESRPTRRETNGEASRA